MTAATLTPLTGSPRRRLIRSEESRQLAAYRASGTYRRAQRRELITFARDIMAGAVILGAALYTLGALAALAPIL